MQEDLILYKYIELDTEDEFVLGILYQITLSQFFWYSHPEGQ